jgi:hypothetical protein
MGMTNKVMEKMRAKTLAFTNGQKPTPTSKKPMKFRLPDGSRFAAVYDGQKEEWTLSLTVGDRVITVTRTGIHDALRTAGNQLNW